MRDRTLLRPDSGNLGSQSPLWCPGLSREAHYWGGAGGRFDVKLMRGFEQLVEEHGGLLEWTGGMQSVWQLNHFHFDAAPFPEDIEEDWLQMAALSTAGIEAR